MSLVCFECQLNYSVHVFSDILGKSCDFVVSLYEDIVALFVLSKVNTHDLNIYINFCDLITEIALLS